MIWETTGRVGTVQRAFELASAGPCSTIAELRAQLRAEGYVPIQVEGPVLFRQLRRLLNAKRVARSTELGAAPLETNGAPG